ncbi:MULTISPECIES: P-type conjugative transfer protein TrbL [unclassified Sphingomonas]|uniref:P-type conjugative transfer protein TrbL n=1 Tax=unclassified Sphingomonas TaxID=196159 RepID=UPI002151AB33|nr:MULTISPECIES: P-type conjugative transfer protein TrbL [unclassified Sphingomonas]MCR5869568.1 P-type conjugative transfer protein TrbL [Sphingomonas sp. J344]UUX98716.1 P-type conjugative transfer protein TrbL [Sphingomonas sp. J315]
MNDLNVIDRFMADFIRYIDSGFGLLGPDIAFLTATLIGIDITLAGLFWAFTPDQDVLGRLLKKILYVGAFAFILSEFATLADIIFNSFARAGLTAGGGTISAEDLLRPGRLAGTGFSAAWPLLDQVAEMMGFVSFFENFLTIAVLLFAWAIVIIAFFILAVQMFVTILEFKLTALAGFVLVPFALWNRTSFLAERVLGHVVTSGIKVMVLAVIIGIGSGFFVEFSEALQGREPDIGQAMSLVLAALTLFGLGIFGPGIATGLVAGAPQLGAGAALGTMAGAAGVTMIAGGAGIGAARALGGTALGAVRAGTSMGSAASSAYRLGRDTAEMPSAAAGLGGVARAATNTVRAKLSSGLGLADAAERGRAGAWHALSGTSPSPASGEASATPGWARAMQAQQSGRHHRQVALHALRSGDSGGASATPDIKEKDD